MSGVIITTGLLVRDSFDRLGIVCEVKPRPSDQWIQDQENLADLLKLPADVRWWAVMPLTGGLVVMPEPMLEVVRPTSYEDFLKAADHANLAGRKSLALIFPEYVDRAMEGRDRGDA